MNHHEVEPLSLEDEPFPCPQCGGSGLEETGNGDVILCKVRCDFCGGSGYGPPPPSRNVEKNKTRIERLAPPPIQKES